MSLILDALRKSEAERRRGQAPDLYAELPPAARHRHGIAQPWWWLAGALLLGALLAWAVTQRSPAPMQTATAPATSPVDAQLDGVEDRVADRLGDPPASTSNVPAEAVAAPPLSSLSEAVAAPDDIAIAATTVAPPLQQPTPVPAPVVADTPAAPDAAGTAATPPSTTSRAVPATARMQPAPPPALPVPVLPAPTPAIADTNAAIALSDLSANERQQLPPLKVSMHMWAATPADRFAIVDGARISEGDRIGDAVVDSITRDGLVLAWQGRRLRLGIR